MPLPPPPKKSPPAVVGISKPPPSKPGDVPAKTFSIEEYGTDEVGKTFIIYGKSGMGKTTLASMAPDSVFIAVDDGSKDIIHPKTGKKLRRITGIQTFKDVRDALHQDNLWKPGMTCVLDTGSKIQVLGEHYTFETVPGPQGKPRCTSIEDYGYGKGYKHLLDTMRLLLSDLDKLKQKGVHIVVLCQLEQTTISNLSGADYLEDGPKLSASKAHSVRTEFVEWADHVLRIGYPDVSVEKATKESKKGKASGTTDRVIYTRPEVYFLAKSRPIDGKHLPAAISFDASDNDALWDMVFNGNIPEETA